MIAQLVEDIKQKKELAGIMDSFIEDELDAFLEKNKKIKSFLSDAKDLEKIKKSKTYKQIIKEMRAMMRKSIGVFISPTRSKVSEELLKKHESTKERLEIYPELYQRFFHITGNPKTLLDLGCGLNPLSYNYLKIKPKYYAYDINSIVVDIIKEFFKAKKIDGKAGLINLRQRSNLKLPKSDICFMFKLLDSIELEKGHKLAEKIIKQVDSRWLVVSFSTRTLSGCRMNHPYRGWVEQLCQRLGYFYEPIEYPNEIFYLIRK